MANTPRWETMRLKALQIKNYCRFPDVEIEVREHLVLVGPNDVGKTSILGCINLLLGASIQQIYTSLGVADIADQAMPLTVKAVLVDFTDDERANFPDDIHVIGDADETLTIELEVRVSEDDDQSVVVRRYFPETSGRSVSREQLAVIGWHYLAAARSTTLEYMSGRRSPLRTLLAATELGDEEEGLQASLEDFNNGLDASQVLRDLRSTIAGHLSQSMPKSVTVDDLALRTAADPGKDMLEAVNLFLKKSDGSHAALDEQSDGVRQLMTMSFFDLAREAANIVAVDEPELHLHASSQRTVAELFARSPTQRLLVTHSPYVMQRFEPRHVAVVRADRSVRQIPGKRFNTVQKEKANWWSPHLLESLTAPHTLIVEGAADRAIVEAAARARGISLDRLGVAVLDIGGAEKFRHVNRLLGPDGFALDLMGLVDAAESGSWINGLGAKPKDVNVRRVFVCATDLEGEYVLGMGAPAVAAALIAEGVKEQSILQSTGASNVASVQPTELEAFVKKDKVTNAVAVGLHLTDQQISAMPAINGLLNYVEQL
ncbi:ATP-dependent endonuclease [Microbacterium sp. dk485]|uniref:ATP-dependent nuclease n=1 Tax=Microbacterium sp. dk485 TaxID=2560021 RepID=UPI00107322ED|nr:AAA family ATPase [Microbacterium sp. dk485]TFV81787.1 ATP-dependent endonuclease [Microbacterium sp. dk485]